MKRLVSIALILTVAVIPASAQRGGSRGGFSGRGASSPPAFHGSPSFSSPSHFYDLSRAPMPMAHPAQNAHSAFYSANHYLGGRYPAGRPGNNRYPFRRSTPFRGRTFRGRTYGYPTGISYVPYPFFGTPFDDGYDSGYDEAPPAPYASPAANTGTYGYTFPQDQSYQTEPRQPTQFVRPTALPEPAPAVTTTLIFKDGRAPEKIRNYIATHSTVTVIDGPHHHDIPVADLDLSATIKVNRDSGAGFQLPAASH